MKIAAFIVTLVCCGLMFFIKRETKAALLVLGAMTLTLVEIPGIPLQKANLLLQVAFLLSEWKKLPQHFRLLRHTKFLWTSLLIVSFSALLAALTSQYTGIKETIRSELLFKDFAIAYAFWAVKDEKSLKPVLQVSLCCLIVLTVFGVLNYIDRNAMFVNALTEGKTSKIHEGVALGDIYTESDRFRVQSMFKFAFDYGYICAAILLLHLHGCYRHLESKRNFVIALVCCSFGILICGCRIVWVSAIFSIACYSMWVFQLNRNVMYGLIAVILLIISYSTVPAVEDKVNILTDIFIENSKINGSSIRMRMSQYYAVLYETKGNEWFGLGDGYWSHLYTEDRRSVGGLLGVESVILIYLLERGIIGVILWATFYTIIFRFFRKNRRKAKALTGLGFSILTLYLVFAIGTGELGSVYPTMLLLGFVIKAIDSIKTKKIKLIERKKHFNPLTSNTSIYTNKSVYASPSLPPIEYRIMEPVTEQVVPEEPQLPQEPLQPQEPQQSQSEPIPQLEAEKDVPKRFPKWAAILLSVIAIGAGCYIVSSVIMKDDKAIRDVQELSEKAGNEKPVVSEEPVDDDVPEWEKYNKMDSRLLAGGYYIVGLDTIVKARAGDNAEKIAKRVYRSTKGSCYIEVYNGIKATTVLEEGREIKIPKLERKQ